ncbi:MAG: hypothetical protein O2960_27405, partial [Verrucomicrobia bacterium]|nr:hypothetical protein [Verrucomicrobiota bacterium]
FRPNLHQKLHPKSQIQLSFVIIENMRAELMEKILAYNISQMIRVRERRAREKQQRSLAA